MALPRATLELMLPPGHGEAVTEGETVTLMVNALKPLEGVRLRLGQIDLQRVPPVADNTSLSLQLTVPDYIGTNTLSLHNGRGDLISNRLEVVIEPALMDYATFQALKETHIPELVKKSGAEDPSADVYPGATSSLEEEVIQLNIEQLLEFSQRLLGVTALIRKGAYSYLIEKQRKHMKSTIRGAVRWDKTIMARAQKGVDYATVHITDIRKRRWHTPTNLLLVKFHMELFMEALFFRDEMDRREREKKAWTAIYGRPAKVKAGAKEQLEKLDAVCRLHKMTLLDGKLGPLIAQAKNLRKEARLINREAELETLRLKNRAYRDLSPLWQEYLRDYQSYYEDTVLVETQRMADIYALWIVCEMAAGMRLRAHAKSLREFRSATRDIILKYDAPGQVRQGWSDSIIGMLFAEDETTAVPVAGSGKPELFLNYRGTNIYFEARYDLQTVPRQEDIYKVLAYMNNYRVPCGGIIYPGPRLKFSYDVENRQAMAWIPFTWTESAYEVAPDYFAFVIDRLAAIQSRVDHDDVAELVAETETKAREFYDAIATPGTPRPQREAVIFAGEEEGEVETEALAPPEVGAPPAEVGAEAAATVGLEAATETGDETAAEAIPGAPSTGRRPAPEEIGPAAIPEQGAGADDRGEPAGEPEVVPGEAAPEDVEPAPPAPAEVLEEAGAEASAERREVLEQVVAGEVAAPAGKVDDGYAITLQPGEEEDAEAVEADTAEAADAVEIDAAEDAETAGTETEQEPPDEDGITLSLKKLRDLVKQQSQE